MKSKSLVSIHVIATAIAVLTISVFFASSLIAELKGDPNLIKAVKQGILYALPIMLIAMPTLAITGKKLAGGSKTPKVLAKKYRMKFIMINGMILIALAVFLYYQSHYKQIDHVFLIVQVSEFVFGIANITLIGLNVRTGLILSGKLKFKKAHNICYE